MKRRTAITTIGAGLAALAGCTVPRETPSNESTPASDETETPTATNTESGYDDVQVVVEADSQLLWEIRMEWHDKKGDHDKVDTGQGDAVYDIPSSATWLSVEWESRTMTGSSHPRWSVAIEADGETLAKNAHDDLFSETEWPLEVDLQ